MKRKTQQRVSVAVTEASSDTTLGVSLALRACVRHHDGPGRAHHFLFQVSQDSCGGSWGGRGRVSVGSSEGESLRRGPHGEAGGAALPTTWVM